VLDQLLIYLSAALAYYLYLAYAEGGSPGDLSVADVGSLPWRGAAFVISY
jgi:hypothetical protein